MTISANRDGDTTRVRVQITYGPVTAFVVEESSHVRSFYEQLGRLLTEMEA